MSAIGPIEIVAGNTIDDTNRAARLALALHRMMKPSSPENLIAWEIFSAASGACERLCDALELEAPIYE